MILGQSRKPVDTKYSSPNVVLYSRYSAYEFSKMTTYFYYPSVQVVIEPLWGLPMESRHFAFESSNGTL